MKANDRQPRFQFVKTVNRQRKKWWTGLPCFHYSIFLLFCALALYILSHPEDSTLMLLRGSLTHESGVWSFYSTTSRYFFYFQWQLMLSKETYMLKYSGDDNCWALIAFNIITIKAWLKPNSDLLLSKKERNLRRSGSDIHRSLDPSVITVAFILTNVQVHRIMISKHWEDEIYVL